MHLNARRRNQKAVVLISSHSSNDVVFAAPNCRF